MNGCLLFIIVIFLWRKALQQSLAPALRFDFWKDLEASLIRRDYRLQALACRHPVEEELARTLVQAIKQGQMQGDRLAFLQRAFADTQRLHERGRRSLNLAAAHILFTALLSLGLRLLLHRQLWLDARDLGSFALACVCLGLCLAGIAQRWPRPWTADTKLCQAFVASCLRVSNKGPWQTSWQRIQAQAWRDGSDPEPALRSLLEQMLTKENSRVEAGLTWVDELLGPLELLLSLILLAIFCSDAIALLFIELSAPLSLGFFYAFPAGNS